MSLFLFTSHDGPFPTLELSKSVETTEGGLMEVTGLLRHSAISVCPAANEVEVCPHYIVVYRILFPPSYHWLSSPWCHDTVRAHRWWAFNLSFESTWGMIFFWLSYPTISPWCTSIWILKLAPINALILAMNHINSSRCIKRGIQDCKVHTVFPAVTPSHQQFVLMLM